MPEGVQLALMWASGVLVTVGVVLIVIGVREHLARRGRPFFAAEEMPFTGPQSGVLADFASMMNEVGAIDDATYERLLWELRHVVHRGATLGEYTRQQVAHVHEELR